MPPWQQSQNLEVPHFDPAASQKHVMSVKGDETCKFSLQILQIDFETALMFSLHYY